jgi:hypothetical protein
MAATATKLNPVQLHLLELFAHPVTDNELDDVKKLLVEYYDQKASDEVERIWDERNFTKQTIEDLLNSHVRSVYKDLPKTNIFEY